MERPSFTTGMGLRSVVLGLLGFALGPLSLNYTMDPFNVTIIWSFLFPLIAGLAYGWRGGLVAGTLGLGAFFPLLIWRNNGWPVFLVILAYLLWYVVQGLAHEQWQKTKKVWQHPILVQFPYMGLYILLIRVLYPPVFLLNPPFWEPLAPRSMPVEVLDAIVFKNSVSMFFVLLGALTLLRINLLRRFLGLEQKKEYRKNLGIFLASQGTFLVLWFVILVLDRLLIQQDLGFHNLLPQNAQELLLGFVFLIISYLAAYVNMLHIEGKALAESQRDESRRFHKESLDSLPIALGILGPSGEILHLNPAFVELFGYTLEEIPHYEVWVEKAYPDPGYREYNRKLWEGDLVVARERGDNATPGREYRIRCKDGREKQVIISSTQVGELNYTAFLDMTEKNRLMNAVQRGNKLESLGILAGGIAHDFNNLLAGIQGNLELALHQEDRVTAWKFLEKSLTIMDRARGLTGQLLTFSKGGAPNREPGQLFPYLQEVVEFALSGTAITAQFTVDPGLKTVLYDSSQLAQVVDNLVINARQAMAQGGCLQVRAYNLALTREKPELRTLWQNAEPGDYVCVELEDNGSGMEEAHLKQIFDPFFSTKEGGQGLGLAMVYSILRKHGGDISVRSQINRGTTFSFLLPAWKGSLEAPVQNKGAGPLQGRGSMLVMDDEPMVREMLGEMLEMLGFDVHMFPGGAPLLEFLKSHGENNEPLLGAILDLTVPGGLGGLETARKNRETHPNLKLYILSGYSDDLKGRNLDSSLGIQAFLEKPFRLAGLAQMLGQ